MIKLVSSDNRIFRPYSGLDDNHDSCRKRNQIRKARDLGRIPVGPGRSAEPTTRQRAASVPGARSPTTRGDSTSEPRPPQQQSGESFEPNISQIAWPSVMAQGFCSTGAAAAAYVAVSSVNDSIPDFKQCTVTYSSFDSAVKIVARLGHTYRRRYTAVSGPYFIWTTCILHLVCIEGVKFWHPIHVCVYGIRQCVCTKLLHVGQ